MNRLSNAISLHRLCNAVSNKIDADVDELQKQITILRVRQREIVAEAARAKAIIDSYPKSNQQQHMPGHSAS